MNKLFVSIISALASFAVLACVDDPSPEPVIIESVGIAQDLGAYPCPVFNAGDGGVVCASDADYSGIVYMPATGMAYLKGGGHSATYDDGVAQFDPGSLAWSEPYPSTACADMVWSNFDATNGRWITSNHMTARHDYDLVVAVGEQIYYLGRIGGRGAGCNGLTDDDPYIIGRGRIAAYAPLTGEWTYTTTQSITYDYAAEYDVVSGKVLAAHRNGLWWFDPATGSLSKFKSLSGTTMGWEAVLVPSASQDEFYWMTKKYMAGSNGGERRIYKITLNRTDYAQSIVADTGVLIPAEAGVGWAYNSDNDTIGGGMVDDTFYTYDPVAGVISTTVLSSDTTHQPGELHSYAITHIPGLGYVMRTRNGGERRTFLVPN